MAATAAISFSQIPSNIRNPLFYAEVSNNEAGYFTQNSRTLIIGQSINTIVETPVLAVSSDWVKQTYGSGSQLAIMVDAFRANNSFSELWVLPLNDAGSAVAATSTITITGTPTASGTIALYIGDNVVYGPVTTTDTPSSIAASLVIAISNNKDLPVLATAADGVVTLTAKNKGTVGNTIPVQLNFRGPLANESIPAGLTVVVTAMASGATNPVLSDKLVSIRSMDLAFYAHPYTDTTSLDAMKDFLAARWNALVGQDGHAWTAISGTVNQLQQLGSVRNDPAHSIIGFEDTSPSWALDVLGAYVGQATFSLSVDPARTLQTLELAGVLTPKEPDRFSLSSRSTLLNNGISTLMYKSGNAAIERAITTYQKNTYGQTDPSYLDVTTRVALTYIKKSVEYVITQKYPRSKLAQDGTIFGAGNAIVTPKDIRAELIAWYDELQFIGICQNPVGFEEKLLVSLNPTDPNRVDVLLPPTLINNLIVFATKVEFRLRT